MAESAGLIQAFWLAYRSGEKQFAQCPRPRVGHLPKPARQVAAATFAAALRSNLIGRKALSRALANTKSWRAPFVLSSIGHSRVLDLGDTVMAGLYKDLAVAAWMEGITPEPPDPARAAMAIIVKADQRAADAKKWNLEASVVLAEMVSLESGKGDCDG